MPDAPNHRLRRAALVTAVVVVVVLVVAELGARALGPYLPEPTLWGDEATKTKVGQMDARTGTCTDLVVAGNSMGRDAFIPSGFQTADPDRRRAYNASLDAASPPLLARWLTEEVVPRTRPATVVLTLASLDVNSNSKAAQSVREKYDDAPLTKAGAGGRAEASAIRTSAILQHRTELRQPSVVWSALDRARRGEQTAPADSSVLGPDGEGLSRRSLHYTGNPASKAFLTGQLLNDYSLGAAGQPTMFDAERSLIDELRARGITVVLAVLPVTDDYIGLHPGGRAQFDDFLGRTRQLATETGVPLLDLHAGHDVAEFADTHHLNADGAERFTQSLPALLQQNGVPVRRCQG